MADTQETAKQEKGILDWKKQSQEIAAEIGNSVLTAYFLVMMVLYPLYMKHGYQEIGNAKFYFFRNVSLVTIGVMLPVAAGSCLSQKRGSSIIAHYKRMSGTDWFVYGYLISLFLSYLCTAFKKEAFWGAAGWYMGFVSQMIFISLYFLFSRYFRWNDKLLYVVLCSSGLVFLLGILNRYSIYPLVISGQTPVFISTLGNINWFCGYWAVICPLGILFYWNSRNGYQRMAAGVYAMLSFLGGVVQGSSSAYLALAGIFIFLFCISFRENRAMCRFLELCFLFTLSCQMARLLRYLPDFAMNYENELGNILTDTGLTLYIGILIGGVYLLLDYRMKRKDYQIAQHKGVCRTVMLLLTVLLSGYIVLLLGNTCLPEGISGLSGVQFFTFNDTWASSRGATWSCGILAYRHMSPLYKLVGVGPDCFAEYVYAAPELAQRAYEQFGRSRLTNAHNEWITVLVNQGIIGLICYAGIFLTAFGKYMKKARMKPALYLCAASVLTYMVHNMVSFQQVLNTPFVFMVLGIGEGVCRREKKETVDK